MRWVLLGDCGTSLCVRLCVQTAGHDGTLEVTNVRREGDIYAQRGAGEHSRLREVTGLD
jgi:hypothetical protein